MMMGRNHILVVPILYLKGERKIKDGICSSHEGGGIVVFNLLLTTIIVAEAVKETMKVPQDIKIEVVVSGSMILIVNDKEEKGEEEGIIIQTQVLLPYSRLRLPDIV